MSSPLADLSTPDLERLLEELRAGELHCPLSSAQLQAANLGHLSVLAAPLGALDAQALDLLLTAVLAERRTVSRAGVELVWTGPEGERSTARNTAVVVRRLFEQAQHRVVVAGYVFTYGTEILRPFHAAMERGAEGLVFLHILEKIPAGVRPEDHLRRCVEKSFLKWWTFGPPHPRIFYDPRTLDARPRASLHAKCVVVDEVQAFVSSANFTSAAHERNLEVGVLVRDGHFAKNLADQWLGLVTRGVVKEFKAP